MSFLVAAVVGAVAMVGTAVYGASEQRKGMREQRDALNAAQAEDARKTAEAETSAQVAANAKLADAKRRRRSSSLLASGDPSMDTLGGAPSALAAGRVAPAARAAMGASTLVGAGTALGAGAPATVSSGRASITRPSRATSL